MSNARALDGLFDDAAPGDLSGRTLRGGAVTGVAQAAKFVINLGSLAILARLLTPADFGLLAMAMVFVGFALQMKDFGLSVATVQSRTITHERVSALFWLNIALSAALAAIFAAASPAIAAFYENESLREIVLVLSAGIFGHGLGAQHTALLKRRMAFRTIAAIEVGGLLAGSLLGVALALAGAGWWALVAMQVAQPFVAALIAFRHCPWVPGQAEFGPATFGMIRFGGNLAAFNIVNYVTRNADDALIGRYVGESALGAYSRAYGLLMLPIRQLSAPIAAVTLPALSRLQDDAAEFRRYFLKSLEIIALLTMPTVVVMGVLAHDIVLLVMGSQWGFAAELFQVFSIFAFFQAVPIAGSWTMIALGRSDRMLKWGTLQAAIAVPVFVAGLPWGAMGVAVASTLMALTMMGPALAYALRGSPLGLRDVLEAVRVPLLFSLSLLPVLRGLDLWMADAHHVVRIAALCAAALVQFGLACVLAPRLRHDFMHFLGVLRRGKRADG